MSSCNNQGCGWCDACVVALFDEQRDSHEYYMIADCAWCNREIKDEWRESNPAAGPLCEGCWKESNDVK